MSAVLEAQLRLAQQGDRESMALLLEENAPLIWSIVRRFFGRGVENDDLFQIGSIGFIKAVKGFDFTLGNCFSTYAVPKIAGEIRRFLRDDGMIKVSRSIKENASRVSAAREAFEKQQGRAPRVSELCALTGLTQEDLLLCEQVSSQADSLDAALTDDGFTLQATLHTAHGEAQLVERLAVSEAVRQLEKTQQAVIILRYFRDLTQQKTARILGISQVQVSRLEKKACIRMRQILQE